MYLLEVLRIVIIMDTPPRDIHNHHRIKLHLENINNKGKEEVVLFMLVVLPITATHRHWITPSRIALVIAIKITIMLNSSNIHSKDNNNNINHRSLMLKHLISLAIIYSMEQAPAPIPEGKQLRKVYNNSNLKEEIS